MVLDVPNLPMAIPTKANIDLINDMDMESIPGQTDDHMMDNSVKIGGTARDSLFGRMELFMYVRCYVCLCSVVAS